MNKFQFQLGERLDRIERLLITSKKALNFEEGCEYTGLSKNYMYSLTSGNLIPFSKPRGKLIYFDKDKLDHWLLQNPQKTVDELEMEAVSYANLKRR